MLLVPRRDDGGPRDRIWAWCKRRWETYFPDVPIFEGYHTDGPFNRSAALNRAARLADVDGPWDIGIVIDSDIFLRVSQVRKAIDTAARTGHVTWAHRRWRGFHESWTTRTLDDRRDFGAELDRDDMDIYVERTNPISWSCCIAFPRAVWDDLGGFDERFVGWGFEDMALQSIVVGLYGHERVEGDVYHLFHPRSEERIIPGQPGGSASREYVTNARLGRRYMVALRRDHGLHDRPGLPASAAERDRDIANLERDDEKLTFQSRHMNLPDWSAWWPSLEELRDGAKTFRAERALGTVTAVVTSGGTEETWPARREYLRQALASFTEHVSGPIVQRVVYSDWPADIHAEVGAIAAEFGFYAVGGSHVGYTEMRQRLWRYLRKRATGDYVFATEDDFTFTRDVDLRPMIVTLRDQPHLTQIALLRDACYQDEKDLAVIGNILGWPEPSFQWREGWIEHRNFWTANTSLFRRSLADLPWPTGHHSETLFGHKVFTDPAARSAFWGDGREEQIRHIGEVRAGAGY